MNRDEIRAAILGSDDLPREAVDVPWELSGEKVYVQALTAKQKDWYLAQAFQGDKRVWGDNVTAEFLVKVIVTEKGERIFTDEDAEKLGEKSSEVLDKLSEIALRLSGMNKEGAKKIAEDFTLAQSDGSVSA